jgi:hypothetical protein
MVNKSVFYKLIGVGIFGRIIPTGGILIRRLTGARMVRYTFRNSTLTAAREFFLRACAVETAHSIVFILMNIVVAVSCVLGKTQLAIWGTVANLMVNVYPMLLQRYTRVRIFRLLVNRMNRL